MKRNLLMLGALLCFIGSNAVAAGIIGTSRSFSTSAFCKQYQCTLKTRNGNAWLYETKFGDFVLVSRASEDPGSKVVATGLWVKSPDLKYFPEDKRTLNALQVESLGAVKVALQETCYDSSESQELARLTIAGRNGSISCSVLAAEGFAPVMVTIISSLK